MQMITIRNGISHFLNELKQIVFLAQLIFYYYIPGYTFQHYL